MRRSPVALVRSSGADRPLPVTRSTPGEQAFNIATLGSIFLLGIYASSTPTMGRARSRGRALWAAAVAAPMVPP